MGIMEWILIIIIIMFFVNRLVPVKGIANISVREAKDKFKDNRVQFIDVRTPVEYKSNHRTPFKNIPLSNLPAKVDKLDKEKEIVVICQSGMRSAKAAKMLKKQGFQKIYNVKGGMNAWM
ncbi:rhodanese-like domain-containing protein [Oceanobacillus kapialis]|uniref:Rhodanese-like domain-containing protein n=1 Tax=Oceanobacillus kapialis TaxID=481353 RepID=A0ABW5PWF5_9BACI